MENYLQRTGCEAAKVSESYDLDSFSVKNFALIKHTFIKDREKKYLLLIS